MKKRPVIGITADFDPERAGGTHLIYNSYIEAIRKAGGVPLLLMPTVRTPENWGGDLDEFLQMRSLPVVMVLCSLAEPMSIPDITVSNPPGTAVVSSPSATLLKPT